MVNPPVYHGVEAKDRESKVDVLVAAGPAGKEPTHLADTVLDTIASSHATRVSRSRT